MVAGAGDGRRELVPRCRRPLRLAAAGGEDRAQADQPAGGQDAPAGRGQPPVTSRARATRRGAGARRRASCPCRGPGRPTSRRAASPNSRSSTSSIRLANRAASFWVLPTPPGNRLSPVNTCTPASSGPAPDEGDAARRVPAQVDHLERLRRRRSRCRRARRCAATGTGRSAASAGCATVTAPVASTTSGSARWWSQWPCVVTTVRSVGVADQRAQRLRLGGRVDQQRLAGRGVAEQVGVVGHLADGELADRQAGQLADVGRAADLDVAGVRGGAHRGLRSESVGGRRYGPLHGR